MKTTHQVLCFVLYTSLYTTAPEEFVTLNNQGKGLAETLPNEAPYDNTHLNNLNSSPQWPVPRYTDETMFIVPRQVKSGDIINVTGNMRSNPKTLVARLLTGNSAPDYNNVALQIETTLPENFTFIIIKDKNIEDKQNTKLVGNHYIKDRFNFEFKFYDEDLLVRIFGEEIQQMRLMHSLNEIKFISLSGDIENITALEFKYNSFEQDL